MDEKKYKKACNILDRIIMKSTDAKEEHYVKYCNTGKYACLPTFKEISYLLTKFNIEHNLEKYKVSHYDSELGQDDTEYTNIGYRLEIPSFKERVISDESFIDGTKETKEIVKLSLEYIDKVKFASELLNLINLHTGNEFGESPRRLLPTFIGSTIESNMWDYSI